MSPIHSHSFTLSVGLYLSMSLSVSLPFIACGNRWTMDRLRSVRRLSLKMSGRNLGSRLGGYVTFWRRRFGATGLAPAFWRRPFWRTTVLAQDVLALRSRYCISLRKLVLKSTIHHSLFQLPLLQLFSSIQLLVWARILSSFQLPLLQLFSSIQLLVR